MHTPYGYGGPVVHWWQNCLQYTGASLDWRYEGIIRGYLALYHKTSDANWLEKATRAGDDLVRGQTTEGNYTNSAFELNPNSGGTPHEAAADVGLLSLATVLRTEGKPIWKSYFTTAERNVKQFYIGRLWDAKSGYFRDHYRGANFVPNKAATLCEALFMMAEITGDSQYVDSYALPTLDTILRHQIDENGRLFGAIYQNTLNGQKVVQFFPYYIARCVPALLLGYAWTRKEQYVDAALAAIRFVLRQRFPDGGFPQVLYAREQINIYPRWIAPLGDVLRALSLLRPFAFKGDGASTYEWIVNGISPAGGIRTGEGFAAQITQRSLPSLPDFRDLIPVCGWVDKSFRALAELLPDDLELNFQPPQTTEFIQACLVRGKVCQYVENAEVIEVRQLNHVIYRWRKGSTWAEVCEDEFLWK